MRSTDMKHISSCDRRRFLAAAARAVGVAAGASALGPLSSVVAASPRGRGIIRAGRARNFNVIVLGDSAIWGQGLLDSEKYAMLVGEALQTRLGRPVAVFNFAHSGAVIEPDAADSAGYVVGREVPSPTPSITAQVMLAKNDLAGRGIGSSEVDLVLIDGGINDVSLTRILATSMLPGVDLEQATQQNCVGRMAALLPNVMATFNGAKIVVLGYWQIVSEYSRWNEVATLLCALGVVGGGPVGCLANLLATPLLQNQLITQSRIFHDTSTKGLGDLVYHLDPASKRLIFVDPGFRTGTVYGTPPLSGGEPTSLLWLANLTNPPDPVRDGRAAQCKAAGLKAVDPTCYDASMGHPNIEGAKQYAMSINAALERSFVPQWLGYRMLSVCLELSGAPAPGSQPTAIVHASDPASGSAVSGTVRIGTSTFPTNTPFAYHFCRNITGKDTTMIGGKPITLEKTTVTKCDAISVTAPGFYDVVIDNYGT
jgi:hypothetical protein